LREFVALSISRKVEMEYHYGVESQLPWVHFDDDLPRTRSDEDPALINALSLAKNKET